MRTATPLYRDCTLNFTMGAFANLQTRQDIFDSTTLIKQRTQQPSDFLTDILVQQQQYACIEWIWKFKVLSEIGRLRSFN